MPFRQVTTSDPRAFNRQAKSPKNSCSFTPGISLRLLPFLSQGPQSSLKNLNVFEEACRLIFKILYNNTMLKELALLRGDNKSPGGGDKDEKSQGRYGKVERV